MSRLRLVADHHAGPTALGILVPPGASTVLIVRPRALPWDLLLVQGAAGRGFRELSAAEAPGVARSFFEALGKWNEGGVGGVAAVSLSGGGHLVFADVEDFTLVVCERCPGQPYRPYVFADSDTAVNLALRLKKVLHPDEMQEVYFNTRNFSR